MDACVFQEKPDLWILGKQSIDGDSNQTGACTSIECNLHGVTRCAYASGQMLAALMGWPQATFAAKIDIAEDKKVFHR